VITLPSVTFSETSLTSCDRIWRHPAGWPHSATGALGTGGHAAPSPVPYAQDPGNKPAPKDLTLATSCPTLPQGGKEAIARWLERNVGARMVLTDVFAKVRDTTPPGLSAYDNLPARRRRLAPAGTDRHPAKHDQSNGHPPASGPRRSRVLMRYDDVDCSVRSRTKERDFC